MKAFTKILVTLFFASSAVLIFAASKSGWGVSGLNDPQTRSTIQQNCPEYYQNRNGDCLRRTFRSYYLIQGVRGGGFGGGGK